MNIWIVALLTGLVVSAFTLLMFYWSRCTFYHLLLTNKAIKLHILCEDSENEVNETKRLVMRSEYMKEREKLMSDVRYRLLKLNFRKS